MKRFMQTYPPRPPRLVCVRPAFIDLHDGHHFTCLIRNVSMRGACITPIGGYPILDTFELEDEFTLERWKAEVVWRGTDRAGVRLLGKAPLVMRGKAIGFGRRVGVSATSRLL